MSAWIVIPNWERFQHYKDRRPKWIKFYVELLDDPEYLRLTAPQRCLLHDLWLLFTLSRGLVPLDLNLLNRRLGLSVKMSTLASLNHAGFIQFSASKPVPIRYTEKEEEKEKTRAVTSYGRTA
jgi:hypothetical protein